MKIIQSEEALKFLDDALEEAKKATCMRSKVGSVIVKDNVIIGRGFNSPPGNIENQRRCNRKSEIKSGFKSDKTCCVHAEQRAIMDAYQNNPDKLIGSKLYLARLTGDGEKREYSKPYCTICSKLILDAGISEIIRLWPEGVIVYDSEEYNDASFAFDGQGHELTFELKK